MIQITDKLVAVTLPEDAFDISVWNNGIGFKTKKELNQEKDTNGFYHTETGLGKWRNYKIIGEVNNYKINFDCERYVDKVDIKTDAWDNRPFYKNYLAREGYCDLIAFPNNRDSYKDSFISLLRSIELELGNKIILLLELNNE